MTFYKPNHPCSLGPDTHVPYGHISLPYLHISGFNTPRLSDDMIASRRLRNALPGYQITLTQ